MTSTYISSLILFIVTFLVIFGILKIIKPDFLIKKNRKFILWKALLYSIIISAIFTIFITIISIKVENVSSVKQSARQNN
jgi:presenilin-like A22 family membrane protease